MISQILKSSRSAIKISAVIALFWFAYYLFHGSVPESALLVRISRWWDVMLGPLYVICFKIFDIVDEEDFKKIINPSANRSNFKMATIFMFLAFVFGLIFGLMTGMVLLCAAMIFVVRMARELHRSELEKNGQIPSVVIVSEESIGKKIGRLHNDDADQTQY